MLDKELQIVMQVGGSYLLLDENAQKIEEKEAQFKIDEENLSILPKFGEVLFIPLRDIITISEKDYRISIKITSQENLILFNLGYKYEDFLRVLFNVRNELLLKDMLMHETLRKSGVDAEYLFINEWKNEELGHCNLRLYETAIVVLPEKGEIKRIPYSEISDIKPEDFKINVTTEYGEQYVFSMLGNQFDPFCKMLSDLMNELSLKVQALLKELLPDADPSVIRRVARFMKEGKAARRGDIETVSKDLWIKLEKKITASEIKEEYDFLKSMAQKERMCIGLKRGLLGDLTGEYIWFLIPIYNVENQQSGNAIAMEAISSENGGKATYFFRIVSRKDYPEFKNIDDLHKRVDDLIKKINRCMIAINFRREPIYLSDERILEPQYKRYYFAIQKIEALRELRKLFVGRVVHSSFEQWKEDVMNLLRFNMSSIDDNERWKK